MTVLRTHNNVDKQVSWDQWIARAKDIAQVAIDALFCIALFSIISVVVTVLIRSWRG